MARTGKNFEKNQMFLNANSNDKAGTPGAWKPKANDGEYIQVDLGKIRPVSQVETRGSSNEWVESYMLAYSVNGKDFLFITDHDGSRKVFEGNTDSSHSVSNSFGPYPARYVRLYPFTFHDRPTLKWNISYSG